MRKLNPLVSIIIPAFRAEYFIPNLVKNISDFDYPNLEVILVFDPSEDNGLDIAKKLSEGKKNWHVFANKKHLGISKSLNLGIKKSQGRYIVFFMTDMEFAQNCISELVKFMEKGGGDLGAVVAKTYDFHKRSRIQAYRMYFMPQTGYLQIPEYGLKDSKQYDKVFEGFSGIDGVLFKKEVFKKVGMFDLDIDSGINDLDMMWRIWLAGYKVIRIPWAKVFHWSLKEGRATEKWEFSYGRMIDVFIQNYSLKYLILYLPQLIAVYSARALINFLQGNPNPLKGWIKSIFWSLIYLPKALKKRKVIQNKVRMVTDEYLHEKIFSSMSLWDFYRYLKRIQKNITPIMLNKDSGDERVLTFSK